jgi:Protein of unknown function (DUF3168)
MSAVLALQAALTAALAAHPGINGEITGVFDGPPPRAAFPFIAVSDALSNDWSAVGISGREVRMTLTVWDDGDEPARLHALVGAVEEAVAGLPPDLPGWRVITTIFLRSLIIRSAAGPWAGLVEHRFRLARI